MPQIVCVCLGSRGEQGEGDPDPLTPVLTHLLVPTLSHTDMHIHAYTHMHIHAQHTGAQGQSRIHTHTHTRTYKSTHVLLVLHLFTLKIFKSQHLYFGKMTLC